MKKRDTGHQSVLLENKTGDSTVLKIGDLAKVVIKQDMKENYCVAQITIIVER